MVTPIATRFVDWDIPELSTLQDSKVYQLRVQLNEGTPMSRQQKNWLTDSVNSNTYFKRAVPLMGYRFDFSDILKRYFVKQYGPNTMPWTRPLYGHSFAVGLMK